MEQVKYRKVPVGVNMYVRKDGLKRLKSFVWKDGNTYEIDKILDARKAASTKVGGLGMRYTVMVEGLPHYLFDEDGKWFMEEEITNRAETDY